MTKRCRLLIGVLVTMTVLPASAEETNEQLNVWREVTFTAPIPCVVTCPYWLDTANTDIDGNGSEDIAFSSCGNPRGTADYLSVVPGVPHQKGVTYDDVLVGPRPEGAILLIFESSPLLDWDTFICSLDGAELWAGVPLFPGCDSWIPGGEHLFLGCAERHVITVPAGVQYILRAYNWSDPLPLQGRYCFSSRGACTAA